MRHVLSAVVQNVPGVLAHISGMLASRGYNIDSLAVGETEDPQLSRMTFVVVGDDRVLEQVRRQLEKIVTVVRVEDVSSQDFVDCDLMLIKLQAPPGKRSEVIELTTLALNALHVTRASGVCERCRMYAASRRAIPVLALLARVCG